MRLKNLPFLTAALLSIAASLAQAQVGMAPWQAGPLPVTLVYPTAAVAKPQAMGPFTLTVAPNVAPLPGRHRLIVMSHGTAGSPLPDFALAATLVRAGFVVAQPTHEGDNHLNTTLAGPASWQRRPAEVIAVIDALAKDPTWAPLLDLSQVGVHGMSAGGVTGLALAGAQWSILNLVKHCSAHPQDDAGFCFNGAKDGPARAEREKQFDRAPWWPSFFFPSKIQALHGGRTPTSSAPEVRPDTRIAAVTLAVPVGAVFSAESLARIAIPVGIVGADQDQVLLPRFHSDRVLAHCKTCTLLTTLQGAGHFDLLSPWPTALASQVAHTQVRGGLPMPGFDAAAREAVQARIAAFFLQHLSPAQ